MPSRKKAKGKARKAAKEAKAKEEESPAMAMEMEAAANQRQEGSLEAMMQELSISTPSPIMCRHGLVHLSAGEEKTCLEFINAFIATFQSQGVLGQAFLKAYHATKITYADVYSSKLDTVISMLLTNGTQRILDERNDIAQLFAALASYFEDYMAVCLHKTRAVPSLTKAHEWYGVDDHTLISYYRKRISCSCLDDKYKEVKSVKKMGRCLNLYCSHPDGRVERSKMFCCTRCGVANYCSVECQKADWKDHRVQCDHAAKMKARFARNNH